jgi:hypothetical protein
VFEFWKIYKGQSACIRSLQPFVDYTLLQLPPNKNANWQNPHILGFMATIVTRIADRVVGSVKSDSMAAIQSGTLVSLTKTSSELIGEHVYLLSSMNDLAFQTGCKNGRAFFESMKYGADNLFYPWFDVIIKMPFALNKAPYYDPLVSPINPELLDLWVANVDDKFRD